MLIDNDLKLDFDDVLIRPKRSELGSRKEVSLIRRYRFKHSQNGYAGIPLIASNMDTIGTYSMANVLRQYQMVTALHKHLTIESLIEYFTAWPSTRVFYSMGILAQDIKKFDAVKKEIQLDFLCIDVANGYSERFVNFVKEIRDENPDITIMAGNVVTGEMVEQLILNGADIVKVGIGPGSVCTTRHMTGVGYPQLSAVIECADAAHGLGGLVCSDGGCKTPGDIVKAFAAGADFVMVGGLLAGHDECEGEVVSGKMKFYGMSSATAMKKYSGGVADYRASEGKEVLVELKHHRNQASNHYQLT